MTDDAADIEIIKRIKDRIDTRLNWCLCEMKPGYDDSIVGFNEAWDVVRDVLSNSPSKVDSATVPDWRKILVAYIGHVIDEESISFLPARVRGTAIEKQLTEAERMALLVAEKEARDMREKAQ